MSHLLRSRLAALGAVSGLVLAPVAATLLSSPADAAPAPTAARALPDATAASWLTSQLTGGLIHNGQYDFDDYGLSIDTAIALDEIDDSGEQQATISAISQAVAAGVANYVGDGENESYAGALAKASYLAEIAGDSPTDFGGVNLLQRLEDRTTDSGTEAGRIADKSSFGDYANTIGQAYAARVLTVEESDEAPAATQFLLDQQCTAGWFRLSFSPTGAPDQMCGADSTDPATVSKPNTDATAIAILALLDQADDNPNAQAAIDRAAAWLVSTQASDGSFGSEAPTTAPNANSTGLAGWALGFAGQDDAAAKAATWLRGRQLADTGSCTVYPAAVDGAVAYDAAAAATAKKSGITTTTADQFRRATAQAIPALLFAPAGDGPSLPPVPNTFHKGGSTVQLPFTGFAPGAPVCSSGHLTTADASGEGLATVTFPKTTGTFSAIVTSDDTRLSKKFSVLGPKTLKVAVSKKKIARKGTEVVTVSGLAKGETVTVKYHGKKVAGGKASSAGRFVAKVAVGPKAGKGKVKAYGLFKDIRKGSAVFTVTR